MTFPWKSGRAICVGECMVELARGDDQRFGLGYGGDTFNTAVYLSRAGVAVAYATAVGDDPYSAGIVQTARREAVDTDLIVTVPGRLPGLYLIETTPDGERTFWYWRDRAPARELFELADAERIADELRKASLVYFSGITLSLYSERGLERFAAALQAARQAGALVAMDSNYRPRGWGQNPERARSVFERFWRIADIAMPTLEDERALWGDADEQTTVSRLRGLGVREVAVKLGPRGAFVAAEGVEQLVPADKGLRVVDTTAAGDSFNAGYLAARRAGASSVDAARQGSRLASIVIQHRGAIVPAEATAAVLSD